MMVEKATDDIVLESWGLSIYGRRVLGFAVLMSADRDNADVAKMIAAAASRHAADPAGDVHAGEGHVHSAWRTWLSALATDAEAAMAAALAYESLAPEAR